jgi:hypothetical protein
VTEERFNQAIQLIKSGEVERARPILLELLKTDPHNVPAWLWLVQSLPTLAQRIAALEQCLKYNPNSRRAKWGLARLKPREASVAAKPPLTPQPYVPGSWPPPIPSADQSAPKPGPPRRRPSRLLWVGIGLLGLIVILGACTVGILLWGFITQTPLVIPFLQP